MATTREESTPSPAEADVAPAADGAFLIEEFSRAVLDGVLDEPSGARNRVDLAVLPFFEDERPLQGVAGLLDWRGCGRLSGYLRGRIVEGALGEPLLTVGGRGLPADRLVLVGLGPRDRFDEVAAADVAARLVALVDGLVARSVLLDLPVGLEREVAERFFKALVEAETARHRSEPAGAEAADAGPAADASASDSEGAGAQAEAPADDATTAESGGDTGGDVDDDTVVATPVDAGERASPPFEDPDHAEQTAALALDTQAGDPGEPAVRSTRTDPPADDATRSEGGPAEAERLSPTDEDAAERTEPEASGGGVPNGDADGETAAPGAPPWWVIADARLAGRLRRVLSGPPRPATGA